MGRQKAAVNELFPIYYKKKEKKYRNKSQKIQTGYKSKYIIRQDR